VTRLLESPLDDVGRAFAPSADASASAGEGRVSNARRIGLIALGALALRLLLSGCAATTIVYDEGYYPGSCAQPCAPETASP